jgi:hypothetical protein
MWHLSESTLQTEWDKQNVQLIMRRIFHDRHGIAQRVGCVLISPGLTMAVPDFVDSQADRESEGQSAVLAPPRR